VTSRYQIDYEESFTIDAPCAEVWSTLSNTDAFPEWWRWLREFTVEGDGLVRGAVLHGLVVAPIPYQMRVDVVVDECDAPRHIEATVHGDLEGHASLTVEPESGERGAGRSRVTARWTVEMMQRPMRVAALVAAPVLRFGHDHVVHATVAEFRRRVALS